MNGVYVETAPAVVAHDMKVVGWVAVTTIVLALWALFRK